VDAAIYATQVELEVLHREMVRVELSLREEHERLAEARRRFREGVQDGRQTEDAARQRRGDTCHEVEEIRAGASRDATEALEEVCQWLQEVRNHGDDVRAREEAVATEEDAISVRGASLARRGEIFTLREREVGAQSRYPTPPQEDLVHREEAVEAREIELAKDLEALEARETQLAASLSLLESEQSSLAERESAAHARVIRREQALRADCLQKFEEFKEKCQQNFHAKTDEAREHYAKKCDILKREKQQLVADKKSMRLQMEQPLHVL
jgi:cell division protein FtsB